MRRALLLWTCAAACAIAAEPRAALAQDSGDKPPALSVSRLEKAIHDLVNRERRAQKLRALAWDQRLAGVARGHSRDMAGRSYFSHESPEGETFGKRYGKARYVCAVRQGNVTFRGAENIWSGSRYASVTTVNGVRRYEWNSEEKIARTVVADWMKSAGHRANILAGRATGEGIGLAVAPDMRIYVTQNFC